MSRGSDAGLWSHRRIRQSQSRHLGRAGLRGTRGRRAGCWSCRRGCSGRDRRAAELVQVADVFRQLCHTCGGFFGLTVLRDFFLGGFALALGDQDKSKVTASAVDSLDELIARAEGNNGIANFWTR